MENWGARLREIREKHGMTQNDLAQSIEKDLTQISRYERGGGAKHLTKSLKRALSDVFSEEEIRYIETGDAVPPPSGADVVCDPRDTGYGAVEIPVVSPKASAGGGNNVESIDVYESGRSLRVDPALFPVPPGRGIRAIRVDGHSMVPVLLPESWVFFEESGEWSGDGLYVLVFRNVLMVKLVEANPQTGRLWIKSANRDYESWEYDPTEDQSTMRIVGRVVRVMM